MNPIENQKEVIKDLESKITYLQIKIRGINDLIESFNNVMQQCIFEKNKTEDQYQVAIDCLLHLESEDKKG